MKYLYFLYIFLASCSQQKIGSYINEYHDGRKVSHYEFSNDTIAKVVRYNSETGEKEDETLYAKGVPDYTNDVELEREFLNYQVFIETLKQHGITFADPIILGSDLRDLSTVLSVSDNYDDFKKQVRVASDTTTIKFEDFNKNIRFNPSLITMFIPENTIIKSYDIIIKDGHPLMEIYETEDRKLNKEYTYINKRLEQIQYKTLAKTGETGIVLEKRFEYKSGASE